MLNIFFPYSCSNVEDIDLFVGGVSEIPFGTGVVGETFGTLIAKQFALLKRGDRFWYETEHRGIAFTRGTNNDI